MYWVYDYVFVFIWWWWWFVWWGGVESVLWLFVVVWVWGGVGCSGVVCGGWGCGEWCIVLIYLLVLVGGVGYCCYIGVCCGFGLVYV